MLSWSFDSRSILGQRVDYTDYDSAVEFIIDMASNGRGGYVCCSTVNMIMEGHDDPVFRRIVNSADLITPDGMPLVWGLKFLGIRQAKRVYGPALTPIICQKASYQGISVGFYGGTKKSLNLMQANLLCDYSDLRIVYAYSPPFRPLTKEEENLVIQNILAAEVRILFVGLGTPKQVRWMAEYKKELPNTVMIGVGAAFDFIAGVKPQAPAWMQRFGLEWLFRLVSEPKRLWKRYLYHNPRFIYKLALQLVGLKKYPFD